MWVTTTKMGPNDVSGVIWAKGTCFFFFFFFFHFFHAFIILTNVFTFIYALKA